MESVADLMRKSYARGLRDARGLPPRKLKKKSVSPNSSLVKEIKELKQQLRSGVY